MGVDSSQRIIVVELFNSKEANQSRGAKLITKQSSISRQLKDAVRKLPVLMKLQVNPEAVYKVI
jgi:hypothetical protein